MQGGRTLLFSLMMTLLLASSTVGCFGPDYHLGVPYREQEAYNYCVPASILMWRLYDGLPELSQSTIFNGVGGAPCDGLDAAYGVALYTASGYDAYFDHIYGPSATQRDEMVSRQITSEDAGVPVMAVVYPTKDHVGIINGGKYEDMGTYWEWEFLYFQNPDPAYVPNYYYTAGTWLADFCEAFDSECGQVISGSAAGAWSSNYSTYGDSVAVYGGGGGCLPGECGPPKY